MSVHLRPVERADLPQLARWRNDPELRMRTREFVGLTEEHQERWFQRISAPDSKDHMRVVMSCDKPVGVVGLCHWHVVNRTAETSFYIGDKNERGKGYARSALEQLHEYGFGELNLWRCYAEVYEPNQPSLRLLLGLGYRVEGFMPEHVVVNGERCGAYVMGRGR